MHTNHYEHTRAIEAAVGCISNPRCDIVLSRTDDDGKLLCGVIYEAYTKASIQAHIAGFGPFWLKRDFLWVMFDYPFNQLKVGSVFCQIREANQQALAFNLKLGFKEVCRIDDVFPDGALVVTKITRDECRWLNINPGRGFNERQKSGS